LVPDACRIDAELHANRIPGRIRMDALRTADSVDFGLSVFGLWSTHASSNQLLGEFADCAIGSKNYKQTNPSREKHHAYRS